MDELDWLDARCRIPAKGHKPGPCEGLLFRFSVFGEIEAKCHRCNRTHTYTFEELATRIRGRVQLST